MIQTHYDWQFLDQSISDDMQEQVQEGRLSPLVAKLLMRQGAQDSTTIDAFLKPDLSRLHDPFLLYDMEKAVIRIQQAIEHGERILIYGDYDADGMTSASVLANVLDDMGADFMVHLPDRFTDGYGPNTSVYKYYIDNEAIKLIVTVDNGVAGHEAVSYAMNQGVDVIITDHHSLPKELPEALAIIHPEHPEGHYPFKDLAGVGVAFKLACALQDGVPTDLLDLVAIGTIADMMSLTDENRILVANGLEIMKQTDRIGLISLFEVAGEEIEAVTEETIGFQIAPRLNALGRLSNPQDAYRLLTSWDEEETQGIAQMIDEQNEARKSLTQAIEAQAIQMMTDSPVEILYHKDWHPGVLGIVAGRLLERYHKPIILLTELEGEILKGSARSIAQYNIFAALSPHKALFTAFGGHAQAAGMTFPLANLDKIKAAMLAYIVDNQIDMSQKPPLQLLEKLDPQEINLDSLNQLKQLGPFGMGNPKPLFLVEDYQVTQARAIGQDNQHLKLKLKFQDLEIDAIYFGHGDEVVAFEQVPSQLAAELAVNVWNGQTTVQLAVKDAKADGIQLIDCRSKSSVIPSDATIFSEISSKHDTINKVLVIDQVPSDLTNLKNVIATHEFEGIYFQNKIEKPYFKTGAGTREQFANLYKLIYQYPEVDVRHKLDLLVDYLRIPKLLLIKMIQIFDELDIIKLKDGVMTVNKGASKRDIFTESQIYQELQAEVAQQMLFALRPVSEIYTYLKEG